jgi:LacI family transcriptional regulator
MVTLKDVARHAAVSTSTASRILHGGKIQVTELTRDRVMRAAEELNYRANSLARSLRTRSTLTLGFLLPDIQNPFYTQLVVAAQEAAQEAGFTLLLLTATDDAQREAAMALMTEDRVDGFLVGGASFGQHWIDRCRSRHVPFVLVNQPTTEAGTASIVLDDQSGARLAARHLIEQGHREIAYLGAPSSTLVGRARKDGAFDEFSQAGVAITENRLYECGFSGEGAAAAIDRLIWHREPVTAIATGSIVAAMLAMKALLQRGIRVPDDVSIVGFHDTPFAQYTAPGITTVRMPIEELGRRAVLNVLAQIDGRPPEAEVVRHPAPILVCRDSVANLGARA